MSFKRINNITGWVIFAIATLTYVLTAEKNGSLWDCGEFVASCFKLQIPHPPGAPMFVLLGRFFIVLFGDNPETAARAVNMMSALASSFTILFLFWTITHFGRKLIQPDMKLMTGNQILQVMGAGAVGALAYTFSDSFWYSAVEGEVYALSSFFTALVFWAMLKWEHQVDADASTEAGNAAHFNADKWIIFIFFMMGISIGVHLLNLLTIPAIVMIYYFKRYEVTKWGTIYAFLIGCAITGVTQKAVIQYTIKWAGKFDIAFVNSFGLPFFSGFAFFFLLLAVLVFAGLRIANQRGWYYLRLGLWCFAFMLIGYSSYLTTMIRSSADPGVDMYNVDNPMSLVGYLGREQYGDFPLVYGQVFTAQSNNTERVDGAMRYQKSDNEYIELGPDVKEEFLPEDKMFFPRVWDRSNDQNHADYYAQYLGIGKSDGQQYMDPDTGPYERRPNFADNLKFFIGYQNYFMYLRYFLWNFSGKQNDVQGIYPQNVRDGNWKTGIGFIDNMMYGDQQKLPETLRDNKANNGLLALPLMFGVIGLLFHYYRHKRDFIVNFLLFFFTGFAIVVYLNQAGNQPRERDYAYVGSFYAFAVWIGLAVPAIIHLATTADKKLMQKILIGSAVIYGLLGITGQISTGDGKIFTGILVLGAILTAITFLLPTALKGLKSVGGITVAVLAISLLLVPAMMASEEWDDHDRSNKTMAPDLAVDYLESCAPNAILFSFGDNDTYPLWYAQEVLGIRTDVRVINYSLLGIDWYVNQMRYKVNNSDPIDVIWDAKQIEGDRLNYALYDNRRGGAPYSDLYTILKDWVGTQDVTRMYSNGGESVPVFPTNTFSVPVDKAKVMANGTVNAADSSGVVDSIKFQINRNVLLKNDLAVLATIAANKWERPIYFTSPGLDLGFNSYLRRDGMAFRLVPLFDNDVNTEGAFATMMDKFRYGNADKKGVYFDEENRRHLNNIRQAFADVSVAIATNGERDKAKALLQRVDSMMLESNMPYGMVSRYQMHNQYSLMLVEAAYRAGDTALASKISTAVTKDLNEQMAFYNSLSASRQSVFDYDRQRGEYMLQALSQLDQMFNGKPGEVNRVLVPGTDSGVPNPQ